MKNNVVNKENTLNSLMMSRYMSLKYLTAILFFMNFYWILNSVATSTGLYVIVPILSVIIIFIGFINQYNGYKGEIIDVKKSLNCYIYLFFVSILMLIISVLNYKVLFPFLGNKKFAMTISVIQLILSFFAIIKSYKIQNNKDNIYKLIINFNK
jgi:ABC superfamily ATP binding cassette transporter permease subunit